MTARRISVRRRVWEIVEAAKRDDKASRIFDVFILSLIFLNVIAVIIGSVEAVQVRWGHVLDIFETVSVIIFSVEFLTRLWSCTADSRFQHPIYGRIRFLFQPMSIIDIIAVLPFYLPLFGADLRSIRMLRLFRMFRLAKAGRYSSSIVLMKNVLQAKKEELVLTVFLMGVLLVFASSALYHCEGSVQPEAFSSIPASMWWAIATLTTVGYGDVYPITVAGKIAASIIAILGIGMFALPTGILGAGFIEEVKKKKNHSLRCPHCGESYGEE